MAPENPSYSEVIDEAVKDKVLSEQEMQDISDLYDKAQTLEEKDKIKEYLDSLVRNDTIQGLNKLKKEIDNKNWNNHADQYLGIDEIDGDDIQENVLLQESQNESQEKSKEDFEKGLETMLNLYLEENLNGVDNNTKKELVTNLMKSLEGYDFFNYLSKLQGNIDFSKINTPESFAKVLNKEIPAFQQIIQIFDNFVQTIKKEKNKIAKSNPERKPNTENKKKPDSKESKKNTSEKMQIGETTKKPTAAEVQKQAQNLLDGKNQGQQEKSQLENKLDKMFPGNDFFSRLMKFFILLLNGGKVNNEVQKTGQSLSNLAKHIKSAESPLHGKINLENLKKLDPKKLENFYKYLNNKGIDPEKNDFWEKALTGKGTKKGDKLQVLHSQLVDSKGQILGPDQNLDDFVKKLNSLGKKSEKNVNKQEQNNKKSVAKKNI